MQQSPTRRIHRNPPCSRSIFGYQATGPRPEQQDAYVILHSPDGARCLVVVSDGMGGSLGGKTAGEIVIRSAEDLWTRSQGLLEDPRNDLCDLCVKADRSIKEWGSPRNLTPGATIVALYLTAHEAHWVHIGDSRLYHCLNGQIISRTKDHSLLEFMVRQGEVEEADMGSHPDQVTLLRALGTKEFKDPEYAMAKISTKDSFLLCSDGLWERIDNCELEELMEIAPDQAKEALSSIVHTAMERNGAKGDNVTVAVVLGDPTIARIVPSTKRSDFLPIALFCLAAVAFCFLALSAIRQLIGPEDSATSGQSAPQTKPTREMQTNSSQTATPLDATNELTPIVNEKEAAAIILDSVWLVSIIDEFISNCISLEKEWVDNTNDLVNFIKERAASEGHRDAKVDILKQDHVSSIALTLQLRAESTPITAEIKTPKSLIPAEKIMRLRVFIKMEANQFLKDNDPRTQGFEGRCLKSVNTALQTEHPGVEILRPVTTWAEESKSSGRIRIDYKTTEGKEE